MNLLKLTFLPSPWVYPHLLPQGFWATPYHTPSESCGILTLLNVEPNMEPIMVLCAALKGLSLPCPTTSFSGP